MKDGWRRELKQRRSVSALWRWKFRVWRNGNESGRNAYVEFTNDWRRSEKLRRSELNQQRNASGKRTTFWRRKQPRPGVERVS